MLRPTQIAIPTLVRVKDGALDHVGIDLGRSRHRKAAVVLSRGIVSSLPQRLARSLQDNSIETVAWIEVQENDVESTTHAFIDLPVDVSAVIGLGGGIALDVAKYIAFLRRFPYYAVPTSLSNDGFCSSRSSLTIIIAALFEATGFWEVIEADPFSRAEWMQAIQMAPSVRPGYYTVLSTRNVLPEVDQLLQHDARLRRCFQD